MGKCGFVTTSNFLPHQRRSNHKLLLCILTGIVASAPAGAADRISTAAEAVADWPYTEGSAGGGRYSTLRDIDRENVDRLVEVWRYRHGDVRSGGFLPDKELKGTAFESTPLMVDGRLIFTTPFNRIIALDPETGEELWTFDPEVDLDRRFANMIINRGVAYWRGDREDDICSPRVFLATLDARLIAVDASTGKKCLTFGYDGEIDLTLGIEPLVDPWEYNMTSPPTVVGDRVIVGSSIADIVRRVSPPGDVRALDVRTGEQVWRFRTIPQPGDFGATTWEDGSWKNSGGANVWSTITADLERGLVFLPVSTATPDFYGGDRPGMNLFSDSLVALNARDGKGAWYYQTVHHDLWDYDLAAPPVLVQVPRDGRMIDAVAQATKSGFVFVLDRDSGEPLFPVEEVPFPASNVPGEVAWPTQPVPSKPPPLVPQTLGAADLWDADPKHHAKCLKRLGELDNRGLYTPPSEGGSILYPHTGGGANWSGAAYDPENHRLFIPVSNLAHVVRLEKLPDENFDDMKARVMQGGVGGLRWLLTGRGTGLRYAMHRTVFWEDGKLCNKPPWGFLVAVDLATGEIVWRVPTGEKDGVEGLPVYGPALATAGGLVFHGGTLDPHLRVHDAETGRVLERFELPAGLHAGPITYKLRPDGRQFLVVAPGGHVGMGSKQGDYVIAYSLSEDGEVLSADGEVLSEDGEMLSADGEVLSEDGEGN